MQKPDIVTGYNNLQTWEDGQVKSLIRKRHDLTGNVVSIAAFTIRERTMAVLCRAYLRLEVPKLTHAACAASWLNKIQTDDHLPCSAKCRKAAFLASACPNFPFQSNAPAASKGNCSFRS